MGNPSPPSRTLARQPKMEPHDVATSSSERPYSCLQEGQQGQDVLSRYQQILQRILPGLSRDFTPP